MRAHADTAQMMVRYGQTGQTRQWIMKPKTLSSPAFPGSQLTPRSNTGYPHACMPSRWTVSFSADGTTSLLKTWRHRIE